MRGYFRRMEAEENKRNTYESLVDSPSWYGSDLQGDHREDTRLNESGRVQPPCGSEQDGQTDPEVS